MKMDWRMDKKGFYLSRYWPHPNESPKRFGVARCSSGLALLSVLDGHYTRRVALFRCWCVIVPAGFRTPSPLLRVFVRSHTPQTVRMCAPRRSTLRCRLCAYELVSRRHPSAHCAGVALCWCCSCSSVGRWEVYAALALEIISAARACARSSTLAALASAVALALAACAALYSGVAL